LRAWDAAEAALQSAAAGADHLTPSHHLKMVEDLVVLVCHQPIDGGGPECHFLFMLRMPFSLT